MSVKRAWLPREGFTADVVARVVRNTALNPALSLPILLLAYYTRRGQQLTTGHDTALRRLKFLVYIGIARLLNAYLSRGAQNNWTSAQYEWEKEVAVITGGSDGIGKHIALLLAEKGVKIASLDIRPPTYESGVIRHYQCDITSPTSVSETAKSIRSTFGNPTILINNAGVATGVSILSSTDESVQRTFDVNTFSHFRLVREFLPSMVSVNHGTIVTIASVAACVSTPSAVDYNSSKSAALAFHEGLAAELKVTYKAPKVRTLCVCPSWVQTSLTTRLKVDGNFLIPILKVETVAEKVVQEILSANSGVLVVPEAASWIGWPVRALPLWWQVYVRSASGEALAGLGRLDDDKVVGQGE